MKTKEIAKKMGLITSATVLGISVAAGFVAGGELGGTIIVSSLLFVAPGLGEVVKEGIINAHRVDVESAQKPQIRRRGFIEDIDLGAKPTKLEIPEIRNGR